jgi:hypothetical protein
MGGENKLLQELGVNEMLWTIELSVKSPSVSPFSPLLSPPIPSISGIRKVRKFYQSNLDIKYWNAAFNAQGSRVIMVIVQVRAVKIYVATVEVQEILSKSGYEMLKRSI